MEYNAVGIDVSKGKSTICIGRPMGEVVAFPFEIKHTKADVDNLIRRINGLDGDTKIVMESTGRYPLPLLTRLSDAGLYVSMVNAKLIKDYNPDNSLRNVKSDKADSKKIMAYTLDKWLLLKQYGAMDKIREQLKIVNRQFDFYMQQRISLQNNLIAILDLTFPGINDCFSSPIRPDGHCKWADFAYTYWHTECVCGKSLNAFTEHYQNWCKKHGYNFSTEKAAKIHEAARNHVAVMPMNETTRFLIQQAVSQLQTTQKALASMRDQMQSLASSLPEYPVVMQMYGVGKNLGPQLMAEIGDIRRFHSKKALVAYAGIDAPPYQSGQCELKSRSISKRGSSSLRRTLFLVMSVILQTSPEDQPIYQFMDKKRSEGKPYKVYMMASANKFLRIYYASVTKYLASLENA